MAEFHLLRRREEGSRKRVRSVCLFHIIAWGTAAGGGARPDTPAGSSGRRGTGASSTFKGGDVVAARLRFLTYWRGLKKKKKKQTDAEHASVSARPPPPPARTRGHSSGRPRTEMRRESVAALRGRRSRHPSCGGFK